MTTAIELESVTTPFADDLLTIADITGHATAAFGYIEKVTTTPRIVAGTLDGIADPLTLPSTVIDPLKLFPYGIGAAIKKFDQITDRTVDEIRAQADKAWSIDERLNPFNEFLEDFNSKLSKVNLLINGPAEAATGVIQVELGLDYIVEQQKEEALRLVEQIGGIDLEGSKLGDLIDGRVAVLEGWDSFDVEELAATIQALATSANTLSDTLPDLTLLNDAHDIIDTAFSPIADAADYLADVLDRDYTVVPAVNIPAVVTPGFYLPAIWPFDPVWVPPVIVTPAINTPAVVVNPAEIITTISSAIQVVQDFVEGLILDALDAIGIDLTAAVDALEAQLLAPLSPIFDAIAALESAFDTIAWSLNSKLEGFLFDYGDVIDFLDNLQAQASLFERTTIGDATSETLEVVDNVYTYAAGLVKVDAIYGMEGNDVMRGGVGDFLFGGIGDDTLYGTANDLFGGDGNDSLEVEGTSDIGTYMHGGDGDDTLKGGSAADTLNGGSGEDILRGQGGDDLANGGADNDEIFGNAGNDTLNGDGGDDVLFGNPGDDSLDGGEGNDQISGNEDNDTLSGGDGMDSMFGGTGNDSVDGGADADLIQGNDGDDTLNGGDGDDEIFGDRDNDVLSGDAGNDLLVGNQGEDSLSGGGDDDRLFGMGDADTLEGDAGIDVLFGGTGDDLVFGGTENDQLFGETGNDTLNGDEGDDKLYGGDDVDSLDGGAGSDQVFGQDGNDFVGGGADADTLFGGDGDDTLDGGRGLGIDRATGGAGADTFMYHSGDARLVVTDFDAAEGDVIDLVGLDPADFATWTLTPLGGGANTLVALGGLGEIRFDGVTQTDVDASWFV